MPVGADIRIHVEVIEQHKLTCQLVVIRRRLLIEQRKRRITVAFAERSQNLIVGAILLHDIDHMLDR